MKLFLSHTKTKDELTAYLSEKAVQYAIERNKCLFVSLRETAKCSRVYSIDELKSNDEGSDTKIISNSIFASCRGATQQRNARHNAYKKMCYNYHDSCRFGRKKRQET